MAYASSGFECGGFVPSWLSCGGSLKGRYMFSYTGLCFVDQAFKVLILKHLLKKNPLVTFITLNAGRLGLGFSSSISKKLPVYQKPQKLIAFPCLLMVLLWVFFGYISSTKKDLLVLCPVACPWSVRWQSRTKHCLSLFLSKERWELRWWGCGGKDDIETMQKMWPFWNSCGLRNISNPRSKGGDTGWCWDTMCLLPALHWKHAPNSEKWCSTWKKVELVLPSRYLIRLYHAVCSFNFHVLVWKNPNNFSTGILGYYSKRAWGIWAQSSAKYFSN